MVLEETVDVSFEDIKKYLDLPWNDFEAFVKVLNRDYKRLIKQSNTLNTLENIKSLHRFYKPQEYQEHVKLRFVGPWKQRVEAETDLKFDDTQQVHKFFQYIFNLVKTFNLTKTEKRKGFAFDESVYLRLNDVKASLWTSHLPSKVSNRLSEYRFVKDKYRALWKFYFLVLNPTKIFASRNWLDYNEHCDDLRELFLPSNDKRGVLRELMSFVSMYDNSINYHITTTSSSKNLASRDYSTYGTEKNTTSEVLPKFYTVDKVLCGFNNGFLGYGFDRYQFTIYSVVSDHDSLPSYKPFQMINIRMTNIVERAQNFFGRRDFTNGVDDFAKALIRCVGHMKCSGCCCTILFNHEEAVIFSLDLSLDDPEKNTVENLYKHCHVQYICTNEPTVGLLCATITELFENRIKIGEHYVSDDTLSLASINHFLTRGSLKESKFVLDRSRYFYIRCLWMSVFKSDIQNSSNYPLIQVYNCDEKFTLQLKNRLDYFRSEILNFASLSALGTIELTDSSNFLIQNALWGCVWNVEITAVTHTATYQSKEGVLKRYDSVRCVTDNDDDYMYRVDQCPLVHKFPNIIAYLFFREYLNEVVAYKRLTKYCKEVNSMEQCNFIPKLYSHGYMFIDKLENTTKSTLYEDANPILNQPARSDCPFIFIEKLIPVSEKELKTLSTEQKRWIADDAFESLEIMHNAGVYHNSIKTNNVIITKQYTHDEIKQSSFQKRCPKVQRRNSEYKLKFIDFGEARIHYKSNTSVKSKEIPKNMDMGIFEGLKAYEMLSKSGMVSWDKWNLRNTLEMLLQIDLPQR